MTINTEAPGYDNPWNPNSPQNLAVKTDMARAVGDFGKSLLEADIKAFRQEEVLERILIAAVTLPVAFAGIAMTVAVITHDPNIEENHDLTEPASYKETMSDSADYTDTLIAHDGVIYTTEPSN